MFTAASRSLSFVTFFSVPLFLLSGCIGEAEPPFGAPSKKGTKADDSSEAALAESGDGSEEVHSGLVLDGPALDVGAGGSGPAVGDGLPSSTRLDFCRQSFPGIVPNGDSGTQYDDSVLSSTQQFAFPGSGEWDDNANYRRYLERTEDAPVHETVDVSNRQFVAVLDTEGRGVGNCSLELVDEQGTKATLTTMPSGRVPVFPKLYGLSGPVRVQARCQEGTGKAELSLDSVDEVATIFLDGKRAAPAKASIDLAFVLDVTGSMSAEIEAMKETIDAVATEIVSAGEANVRLALVAYRDYEDDPAFEFVHFTDDLERFRGAVAALQAEGGGDVPEAVNQAMDWATRLDWDLEATARMTFVIGDAPPHAGESHSAALAASVLACAGVKVFTVATTGQDPTGRFIFRQMSQLSYATHLFLLRGGTSLGDDCADHQFHTDELHSLVIDRVKGELATRELDPLDIPGLGGDRDTEIAEVLDECAAQASTESGEDLSPLVK